MRENNRAATEQAPKSGGKIGTAAGLLGNRRRLLLAMATLGKIAVGFCDLLVAAAMYLLFLQLQGRSTGHPYWWIPRTALAAASITATLVILRSLMDLGSTCFASRQTQNLHREFMLRLTDGYSHLEWGRFVERNRSELSGHALQTTREAADFYHSCVEMIASVTIVAAMTSALVYQSPMVACVLGLALAVFYAGHRFFIRKRLQEAASSHESSLRALRRNLADMLSSGKEMRTYGNQDHFQERIRWQAERAGASIVRLLSLPHFARIVADQGAVLAFLAIVIVVQLRQDDPRQLLSLLVFYFVLSRRMLPLMSQISYLAGELEGTFENVKIVDTELERCRIYRVVPWPAPRPDAGMALQVSGVGFSFAAGAPIIRNVNLSLREGETIVLQGASGIGKSSLLNLIAGVAQPVTGEVRVDRASLAYVPQEIPLLDESIRNNLLFGLPEKSDEELTRALATAELDEFVAALPLRMETGVGDNGALFSGGERQRLGLARAILRGGRLLLLDEATSALDEENERRILENLKASGMAILLVTHRVRARTFADRVFRLEGGVLREEAGRTALIDEPALIAR